MNVPVRLIIACSLMTLVAAVLVATYLYITREWRAYDRCERAYRRAQRVRQKKRNGAGHAD